MQNKTIDLPKVLGFLSGGALPKLSFVDIESIMLAPNNPIQEVSEMPHDALHFTHKETGEKALIWVRYSNYRYNSRLLDPTVTFLNMVKWVKSLMLLFPEYKLEMGYQKQDNRFGWVPTSNGYRIIDAVSKLAHGPVLQFGQELKRPTTWGNDNEHMLTPEEAMEAQCREMAEYMLWVMGVCSGALNNMPSLTYNITPALPVNRIIAVGAGSNNFRIELDLGDGLSVWISPEDEPTHESHLYKSDHSNTGFIILLGKPHHFRFSSRLIGTGETLLALVPKPVLEEAAKVAFQKTFPFLWDVMDRRVDFVWRQV